MPIRRRAWLTREGWYYLAVLAFIIGGAILRSVNLLVVLAGTMLAPLIFNWRLVMASLMGIDVQRKLPEQIVAGEPLTVEIEVSNPRRWMSSWLVAVEDWVERVDAGDRRSETERQKSAAHEAGRPSPFGRWLPAWRSWRSRGERPVRAETLIPHVPAGGRASGTYRVALFRRGRYRFGPLRVATRYPLGLVRGQFTLPARADLIVAPRLGWLTREWAGLLESELAGDQRRQPQRGSSEGDYYGLRPWQTGDSLRWIHWRTTAKLGRPIVRQYERRRGRDVALVLDAWLPRDAGDEDELHGELAVSLTATAMSDILRRGHSILTVAIAQGAAQCFGGPASDLFCQELLARLAELRLSAHQSLAAALAQAQNAAPRGARLIVISPRRADDVSLADVSAELSIEPEQLTWIDTSSPDLERLFVLERTE